MILAACLLLPGLDSGLLRAERSVDSSRRGAKQSPEPSDQSQGPDFQIEVAGVSYRLSLQPSPLLKEDLLIQRRLAEGDDWQSAPSGFYEGRVVGLAQSVAHVSLRNGSLTGIVLSPAADFFIQSDHLGQDRVRVRTRPLSDLPEGGIQCGVDGWVTYRKLLARSPQPQGDFRDTRADKSGTSPERVLELRLLADSSYFDKHPEDAAVRMLDTVHQASAIFRSQLGIRLRVSSLTVIEDASIEDFTSAADPLALLTDLSSESRIQGSGLLHLFTGRDLLGSTVGISWPGLACHPSHAAGLSQDVRSLGLAVVVTAHEIGHSLGARHDGDGECRAAGSGHLMWPLPSEGTRTMSECSRQAILRASSSMSCLAVPSPVADPLP